MQWAQLWLLTAVRIKVQAKYDRIDEGLKACIKLGVIYSLAILVLMIFFGKYLALLFCEQ